MGAPATIKLSCGSTCPRSRRYRVKALGMLGGSPHWFAGDLMEAEAAAAKYQELIGIGGFFPKDPALLSWREQSELSLQVFPCAPSANKSVAYTLLMPTNYFEGKYVLQLPWMGTAELSAVVKVRAARMQDRLFVQGRPIQPNTQIPFPAGESPLEISLEPASPPPVSGALAVVSVAQDRNLIHARFESAPRLSEVPRSARLIALIDVSRSLTDSARQSAVAAARAWLANFPDATAEVVAFDRAVHPYHRRLVPVAQAIKDLETTPVVAGNGSAVDLGLAEAARLLARTRGRSARGRLHGHPHAIGAQRRGLEESLRTCGGYHPRGCDGRELPVAAR